MSQPTFHRPSSCSAAPLAWAHPPEQRASLLVCLSVLGGLTVAKSLAPLSYVGPLALAGAAFWQLRAALWRVERQGYDHGALGCSWRAWRLDVATTCCLAAVLLPAYALAYHAWACHLLPRVPGHLAVLAPNVYRWAPRLPQGGAAWFWACTWFAQRGATHFLGVALPEELFYRGYLQPAWQAAWPPRWTLWGGSLGWATVAATLAFALGHILGEWHLARLGPFFPGLVFAWQRNRSGTIVGAIGLHGLCNLFAEVWGRQYAAFPN